MEYRYTSHDSIINRIELEDDMNGTRLETFPPILICSNNMHLSSVVTRLYPFITEDILLAFYGESQINITVIPFEN